MQISGHEAQAGILAPAYSYSPFRTAAVLGAGTMGAQIAAHLANAGLHVHLLDVASEDPSDPGAPAREGLERARKMRPDPFFRAEAFERITTGSLRADLSRIADAEWIIEAVVERLDVKRSLMERVEEEVSDDAVISTNTSGLGIAAIAAGRSESFKRRFLGTHFFNPPRYLRLLELIPSDATDREVVARVAHFGRIHLGKGIVVAKDTPYFIGNRIGVYAMLQAMRQFTEGKYTIEEIDTLTGPLVGRPRSATFRTADVVGLDVMMHVAENLYGAVPDDEQRDAFHVPDLLRRLVDAGRLGQKSDAGFYKKQGGEIKSVDPETFEYVSAPTMNLPGVKAAEEAGRLEKRLVELYEADGRAGEFFRRTTLDLLAYSAARIPEIADRPSDVDRAMRWGFGWEVGPFEIWDALGFERVLEDMLRSDMEVPDWVLQMETGGRKEFYHQDRDVRQAYVPEDSVYREDPVPDDELHLDVIRAAPTCTIEESDHSALLDIGEGVAVFEFRSKANTLGSSVMQDLHAAIERVERDQRLKGLVVANEGSNFSVGANLAELADAISRGTFDKIAGFVADFQRTVLRVRYARKPVIVAVHQRVLGGGAELVMACTHPVASAESYIGLVELGVGLIPAGTGTARMAAIASERAPSSHPSDVQASLRPFFETVARSTVATSAPEAQSLGFLPNHARIVMNEDRRIFVAREEVLRLAHEGYMPPPVQPVMVLGRPTAAAFDVMVQQYLEGGFITEYDAHLARRFAFVLTGGTLTAPQRVNEQYLLELEREIFLELVRNEKTQARIEHMLRKKKPLRN